VLVAIAANEKKEGRQEQEISEEHCKTGTTKPVEASPNAPTASEEPKGRLVKKRREEG